MKRYRMPSQCPVCSGELAVTRLRCPQCETAIEGSFETSGLFRLSKEQLEFVETFLKCRGNIKEVERELGISYPTVRGRLETVIESLGYRIDQQRDEEPEPVKNPRRKEILNALSRGEITSEEAVRLLKELT